MYAGGEWRLLVLRQFAGELTGMLEPPKLETLSQFLQSNNEK